MRASLFFLGTGAPDAGSDDMPAVAFKAGSNLFLLDSGEGVQHKLVNIGIGLSKVSNILITHLHGDHVLGLVPFIQTRTLMFKPAPPIAILGPPGLAKYLNESFSSLYFDPGNSLEVQELKGSEELKIRGAAIRAELLDHTVFTIGYLVNLSRDFSLCYLTDTRPLTREDLNLGCSVLIHDSTFSWIDLDRAREFKHTTALEAAMFAARAGAKLLFLYHISSRYRDRRFLESEARRHHPNSHAAAKYMRLNLVL
ncbi:MAG: MBL fold metallo-hydrolase [Sulfolobales archaeon]